MQRYLRTALTGQVLLAAGTMVLVCVAGLVAGYRGVRLTGILLAAISVIGNAALSLLFAVLEAKGRIAWEAYALLGQQLLWTLAAVAILTMGGSHLQLLGALGATAILTVLGTLALVRGCGVSISFGFEREAARRLLRAGLPLAGAAILVDLYLKVDILMIDRMIGSQGVGQYGAAQRLVQSLTLLTGSFFTVMFPVFSRLQRESPRRLNEVYAQAIRVLGTALIPVAVGTSLLAQPIVTTLFGGDYAAAASPLSWMIWIVPIGALSICTGRLLVAVDRQEIILRISALSVALNVGVNYLLIPRFGPTGAAMASVMTSFWVAGIGWWVLGGNLGRPNVLRLVWKPAAVAALMGAIVYGVRGFSLGASVGLGILSYAALLLVSGAIDPADRAMLARAFRRD